jgi:hypothetical protein
MKGHVRERGKGHWYAVIETRDASTGKRKRKWVSLPECRGKREAQLACGKLIAKMDGGAYVEPSKTTLAQFFDRWLKHIKPNVSPHARAIRADRDKEHCSAARSQDHLQAPADRY